MLKWLRKANNRVFGIWQQRSKIGCLYLPFENLKIKNKKDEQYSETQKESTNDIFGL